MLHIQSSEERMNSQVWQYTKKRENQIESIAQWRYQRQIQHEGHMYVDGYVTDNTRQWMQEQRGVNVAGHSERNDSMSGYDGSPKIEKQNYTWCALTLSGTIYISCNSFSELQYQVKWFPGQSHLCFVALFCLWSSLQLFVTWIWAPWQPVIKTPQAVPKGHRVMGQTRGSKQQRRGGYQ